MTENTAENTAEQTSEETIQTAESSSTLERKVTLKLSEETINQEVEKRLKKIARTAKMPGFRPGKVPMKMVLQNYGAQVHSEVLSDELGRTFSEEMQKGDYRVAGSPKIEKTTNSAQDSFEFDAVFEVFPEVKVGDLSSLEIEKSTTNITDEEVQKTLDILRKQRSTFAEVDRGSKEEDRVTLDFVGKIEDVAFEGGTASDFPFVLGKGQMLPEFEQAATGMKAGESKIFDLPFPEDYHGKDVAGKTAQFEITIKKVEESQLPEVDEEFAKQMGVEDGSVDKLKEDVRSNLTREVNGRLKAKDKEAVMDALVKLADFEIPKALVESEVVDLVDRARDDLRERGMKNVEEMKLPEDLFQEQAKRRVRLGLIISSLVKEQDLAAKPDQVKAFVEEQAKSYQSPTEVIQWYLQDKNRLAEIEAIVLEDNVVEWVLSGAKVTKKEVPFEDLMGNPQQAAV